MKLKAFEILNAYEALGKLADRELDLDAACMVAKNLKELSISREIIENKRNTLISDYAEKDEDGNIMQGDNGNIKITDIPALSEKLNGLLVSETEVTLSPIPKSALSEIKISPKDILALTNIIKEDNKCTH